MNIQSFLPSLKQLPESFAVIVDDISAISVSGEESDQYLQGQLTCDVEQLAVKKLLIGGHCDAKGKLFSAFRLINHFEQRLMIQSKHSLPASLAQLQKFGVFAKVEIKQASELRFLMVTGTKGSAFIQEEFSAVPDSLNPVVAENNVSIAYLGEDRYLLIASKEVIEQLSIRLSIDVFSSEVWTLLEIQSGFAHMSSASVGQYVPQMLNLQYINGISFSKGCYLGQETVARMKYLGRNKKALFALHSSGDSKFQNDAQINDQSILEKQIGENWRRAGEVIAHYKADDGNIYIQAVLANDTEQQARLRLKHQNGIKFNLMPLPYSLSDQE